MQASFRRKMGRVYRGLLKQAKAALAAALRAVHAAQEISQAELQAMDAAVAGYHSTMGRFGQIFAEYVPPEYEAITALKRGMKERIELHGMAQAVLGANPPDLHQVIHVTERYAALSKVKPTAEQRQVEQAVLELHAATVGAINASAEEALRLLDRVQMVAVAKHAAQYRYQTADLLDIGDKLLLKVE